MITENHNNTSPDRHDNVPTVNDIRLLLTDVDGTLTDGKIYMGADGELLKAFDVKDGYGIAVLLPKMGITPVVITARESRIVSNRCREIGINEVHQGCRDKAGTMREVLRDFSTRDGKEYTLANVAYAGDDIPDLECMTLVRQAGGIAACPADATGEIKAVADFMSSKNGGDGAVREIIEWLKQR